MKMNNAMIYLSKAFEIVKMNNPIIYFCLLSLLPPPAGLPPSRPPHMIYFFLKTPLVFNNHTKQLVAKSFETVEIHNPIVSFVKQENNFETISNHNSGARPFDTVKL